MADYTDFDYLDNEQEESGTFNFKALWLIILIHWKWILLSVMICLGGAFAYLRIKTPIYAASAKILVKDDDNRKKSTNFNNFSLADMGIITNSNGFDNELEILTSTTIARNVATELKLYTRYHVEGRFKNHEAYKNSPILVDMGKDDLEKMKYGIKLTVTPKGKGIHVEGKLGTEIPNEFILVEKDLPAIPGTMATKYGTLQFSKNEREDALDFDGPVYVTIAPLQQTALYYAKSLRAEATSKTTTVAQLSIADNEVERAIDYLNQLVKSYNEDANKDKNEIAEKTKVFIEERLDSITLELDITEGKLEEYKRQNELINLTNDATNSLTKTTDFQREQVERETEITMVQALLNYVRKPENLYAVIPANLGIKDQVLNNRINTYNEALLQFKRLTGTGADSNPALKKMQEEVEGMHATIENSLSSIYENLLTQKKSVDKQYNMYAGRIEKTPRHERALNDIARQQEIKSGLYLMLLQKREENFISLASTATKAKVIDEPQFAGKVAPRGLIIWVFALLLGICCPVAIFFLLELMRYRIEGRSDVEKLTKIPIISDIPLLPKRKGEPERSIVVSENNNDSMDETFRGLRTNLRFIMNEKEKVILSTSTIPGEGKTFISSNLAMSFAILGKKVLLIGLDIRKPRLVGLFNLASDKRGITEFLRTETAGFDLLEAQIHRAVKNKNLDVLPAGIIPPNPGELISRKRLDEAIDYLRTKYDIIIIDTPPVGLVSDTLEIGRVADVCVYVCRADYSPKSNFDLINSIQAENKLPKLSLILNGIDMKKKKYGYYYGYGKYGKYGHYGHYGTYGNYSSDSTGKGTSHVEK